MIGQITPPLKIRNCAQERNLIRGCMIYTIWFKDARGRKFRYELQFFGESQEVEGTHTIYQEGWIFDKCSMEMRIGGSFHLVFVNMLRDWIAEQRCYAHISFHFDLVELLENYLRRKLTPRAPRATTAAATTTVPPKPNTTTPASVDTPTTPASVDTNINKPGDINLL